MFVVELFITEEDARRALEDCLRDESQWSGRLEVTEVEFYRFRVVKLDECVQAHRVETYNGYPWRSNRFTASTPGFGSRAEARQALRD